MIDIHNHILPGLDDGSQSLEESLEMARMAVSEGISTVIATPHHWKGPFVNCAAIVKDAVRFFNESLKKHQIPLEIRCGQEIHVYPRLIDDLYDNKLLTLAESPYLLIEFPSSRIPGRIEDMFHELAVLGLTPIIAHPERNREIAEHPDKLGELVARGALCQVTSHSITGRFGSGAQSAAMNLCRRNLVHFIASDAHNVTDRPFHLPQASEMVRKQLGGDYADYFQQNAQRLMNRQAIHTLQPVKKKGGKLFAYNLFGAG